MNERPLDPLPSPTGEIRPGAPRRSPRSHYVRSMVAVAACTAIAWFMHRRFAPANLIMVYLLGVTWVAASDGRGPAIVASLLSVALFDFFFVPPPLTLAVSDTQYVVTFAVMLLVAVVISTMASRLRQQSEAARHREHRTAALYGLSRELAATPGRAELLEAALRRVEDVFASRAVFLLPGAGGGLAVSGGDATILGVEDRDRGVAQWAFDHEMPAGLGTSTLPGARAFYLPLRGVFTPVGILGVAPREPARPFGSEQLRLLETFANQIALAIERARLAEQAEENRVRLESERLREALLGSVSHDLRTPLAVITGASSSLLAGEPALPEPARRELVETIAEESQRLNRLVGNLLDMTRLESGAIEIRKEWHSLEEVIGAALGRLDDRLRGRAVSVAIPESLPLVPLDDVLIEQVLFNLIENAVKYTPPGSPLDIRAELDGAEVAVEVLDRGPGIPAGEEDHIFAKFHRIRRQGEPGGVGLGLAICSGLVRAHGGTIVARNRPGGGAVFRVTLPREGEPPRLEAEEPAPNPGVPAGAPEAKR